MDKINLSDELKKAKEWAKINLVGKKVYHKDIEADIILTKKGIEHSLYVRANFIKIELIYNAFDLIESSTLSFTEKDKKERNDIKNIYKLMTTFKHNKKNHTIYIVIRETEYGHLFYDMGIIKKP